METQHRQEFESFMIAWDDALRHFNDVSNVQIEQLRQRHARELEELRLYLEQATSIHAKPSPEILNMRKIQQHLSKQKKQVATFLTVSLYSYTEAEKVQRVVNELEEKNQEKYNKQREDKILTQLSHMQCKHQLERDALFKKIEGSGKEQEKARRLAQQQLLQRFLNAKNFQKQEQMLESSKLLNQLKIKNYASTIVGKLEGSLKSVPPPNMPQLNNYF